VNYGTIEEVKVKTYGGTAIGVERYAGVFYIDGKHAINV
jgi:hypothetical protein